MINQCTCNDTMYSEILIYTWVRDEIKYRAMGWFEVSDFCREMVHQIERGNYGHLCNFNGMFSLTPHETESALAYWQAAMSRAIAAK